MMKRVPFLLLTSLGAAGALAAIAISWPSASDSPLAWSLLGDVAIIALAGGGINVLAARGSQARLVLEAPWAIAGALLGAMLAGPLRLAPWLLVTAFLFAVAGVVAAKLRPRVIANSFALTFAAALVNFALLWTLLMSGDVRATAEEFRSKDLRVHSFLADVPLHDVWVIRLRGGGEGRTLADVEAALSEMGIGEANTAVAGLVAVRTAFGRVSGWDDEKYFDPDSSFIARLGEADRRASRKPPGERGGFFQTVYSFEREGLAEMMNRTGHAFFATALEPDQDGYLLYWAIYVREGKRLTSVYLALIDPFRRLLVYPAIVRSVERAWARKWDGECGC